MLKNVEQAGKDMSKQKNEVLTAMERVQKEGDTKFKRVLALDAQVGSLK